MVSPRSNHTANERDQAVADFNSKGTDIDVMVLDPSLSMTGLDIHHKHHKGVIVQYGWNLSSFTQILDRIYQTGQHNISEWAMVSCKGTYYHVCEDLICRNDVPDILSTANIPAWIKGPQLRSMIAHEILKAQSCHAFNRFAWVVNPPKDIASYTSPRMQSIGKFASAIVEAVLGFDPKLAPRGDPVPVMQQLEKILVPLLHQWAEMGYDVDEFRVTEIGQYARELEGYKVKAEDRPFWQSKKTKTLYDGYVSQAKAGNIDLVKEDKDDLDEDDGDASPNGSADITETVNHHLSSVGLGAIDAFDPNENPFNLLDGMDRPTTPESDRADDMLHDTMVRLLGPGGPSAQQSGLGPSSSNTNKRKRTPSLDGQESPFSAAEKRRRMFKW